MPVLCTLQGCCNPPYPCLSPREWTHPSPILLPCRRIPPAATFHSFQEPSSSSLTLEFLRIRAIFIYIYVWRKRVSRRRVVIFTGPLFSGNRELSIGGMGMGRGRGWFWFFERKQGEARFLRIVVLSFKQLFNCFFFCNYKEKE